MSLSVNLFDYETTGREILQSCKIERKMASLMNTKIQKSKECRGFIYKKVSIVFSLNFVQVLYSLYIFCTFIIIQNFDLCNLCIQNIYKVCVLYNFCIHFV